MPNDITGLGSEAILVPALRLATGVDKEYLSRRHLVLVQFEIPVWESIAVSSRRDVIQ